MKIKFATFFHGRVTGLGLQREDNFLDHQSGRSFRGRGCGMHPSEGASQLSPGALGLGLGEANSASTSIYANHATICLFFIYKKS